MNTKWYKLPQLWISLAMIIIIGGLIVNNNINMSREQNKKITSEKESSTEESSVDSSTTESLKSSSEAESASIASSEAKEASETASSIVAEKDPNSYNTGISYDQIARTPDNYEDKKIQFTGKVLQVMEDDDDIQIRLAVDGSYDNVILIDVDTKLLNGSRILEDDLVTASGISEGTTSYKSTGSGTITIPRMTAKIINDQGKASDDYGY